jgi:hypothetical protein
MRRDDFQILDKKRLQRLCRWLEPVSLELVEDRLGGKNVNESVKQPIQRKEKKPDHCWSGC